jgi:glycosyltransferase involved in cell wall biosynthesis
MELNILTSLLNNISVLQVGKYYPPERGGIESHLQTLAGELKNHLTVEVLVAQGGKKETVADGGLEIFRAKTLMKIAGAPICPSMPARIRQSSADIVHVHLPNPGAVIAYLGSGRKGPLVASWHSDIVRQSILLKYFQPLLRAFLNRCDAIIVSSAEYLKTSDQLRPWRSRCVVVRYGISSADLRKVNQAEVTHIRQLYGPRIVLAVGRLVYYKGFEFLIQAMRQVDASLIIAGTGPLYAKLRGITSELGLTDRVIFAGDVEDLKPYYHASDVFVLPSVARSEAFGLVQLEAMACQKPVVNTKMPSGISEVSIDGLTGLSAEPGDPTSLATALNKLLGDPELRDRLGVSARERVENEFTARRMALETLAIYSKLQHSASPARLAAPYYHGMNADSQ